MGIQKIILLIINFLGGTAVISSYILGLNSKNNGANALWGGTPAFIRPIYTVSMVLAALGYFAFIYFILFKLNPNFTSFKFLYFIFLGILLPSVFWMPLTNLFLSNPGNLLWFLIRFVLILVGISSLALVWFLVSLYTKETGLTYKLAIIGSIYFAFHTALLDMILWPIFFRMQS
jgi:FlaA1/EpsC-like NDP-sugar epimerase